MKQLQTKGNDMLDLPVLMPLVISFAAIYLFFRWVVFDMNSPNNGRPARLQRRPSLTA